MDKSDQMVRSKIQWPIYPSMKFSNEIYVPLMTTIFKIITLINHNFLSIIKLTTVISIKNDNPLLRFQLQFPLHNFQQSSRPNFLGRPNFSKLLTNKMFSDLPTTFRIINYPNPSLCQQLRGIQFLI